MVKKTCGNCHYNTDEFYAYQSCKLHRKRIIDFNNVCEDWKEK